MSSVAASVRQVSPNNGYYINVASAVGKVYAYNTTAGASTFSTALWAAVATTAYGGAISTAGTALFKDMGKTVVSAGRTFRKVQLVTSTVSTFGVGGTQGIDADYLTGYIELGFDGANATGRPAPFATYGR